jgi:hypothetical protein
VPYVGDNVLAKLRRPFWTELESRFGNMFNVREKVGAAATKYQSGWNRIVEGAAHHSGLSSHKKFWAAAPGFEEAMVCAELSGCPADLS